MADNGGSAFPVHGEQHSSGGGYFQWPETGMSLRDWFAGQALAGFLANGSQRKIATAVETSADRALIQDTKALAAVVNEQLAGGAYAIADAMLAERSK